MEYFFYLVPPLATKRTYGVNIKLKAIKAIPGLLYFRSSLIPGQFFGGRGSAARRPGQSFPSMEGPRITLGIRIGGMRENSSSRSSWGSSRLQQAIVDPIFALLLCLDLVTPMGGPPQCNCRRGGGQGYSLAAGEAQGLELVFRVHSDLGPMEDEG